MYCSNGSGMATLLQQKNCMKTLSNGGVSGGGNNNSNNTTATALQQTRVLLPHEMVNLPSSVVSSGTSVAMNNVTTSSVGAFVVTQHNQQIIQQNYQQQPVQHESIQNLNSSHNQFNNQVNHVHQISRYFSQFNNQESNINMPTTSANITRNIANTSSQILITNNSNSVVTSALGAATPLTVASLTQHSQYHHQQQQHHLPHRDIVTSSNLPSTTSSITLASQQYQNSSSTQSHQLNRLQNITANTTDNIGGGGGDGYTNPNDVDEQGENFANGIQTDDVATAAATAIDQEPDPEIDIVINNVVCSFSVKCHLNLREIALNGFNVEFRRENGMVTMKLRRPYTTASIWSSGRITCTGATSEDQAKIAARRYSRCLQKLGFNVKFNNFRVVNVLGTCSMPWAIKIVNFSERFKKDASYEPELHPGVTYKLRYPKATLKIFSTGSITVTAGSVAHVQAAIEHIFPLVYEFRKKRTVEELELLRAKTNNTNNIQEDDDKEIHSPSAKRKRPLGYAENDPTEDIMYVSETEDFETEDV